MKKSRYEILVNIIIVIMTNFVCLFISLTLGLFVLIVKYNIFVFDELELLWKEIKEL